MRRLILVLLPLLLALAGQARAETPVDLELVLAVDASGSVDDREFDLQLTGIATAFRSPEVLAAIEGGAYGRIAVALVIWAEHNRPKALSRWHLVQDRASADAFADEVAGFPRGLVNGATGIGKAIFFSAKAIEQNAYAGSRKVVDISGDGRETPPDDWTVMLPQGQAYAAARGVGVNGLAILTDQPDLAAYYRAEVILGFGAFVEVAETYDDVARAMQRKLIREIATPLAIGRLAR
ncbi:MAG: DUF1194 domain-containing protein [Rhodospirillales bacterium]